MQATEEYIHVLASALSEQTGVKIQAGKSWMANVENKVLIYPKEQLRLLPFYAVRGLLLHELSHVLFSTTTEKPMDTIKEYGEELVYSAFDMLEDQRCEYLIMCQYGSFAEQAVSDMNYYGVARMIDKLHGDFTQLPKYEQYMRITHLSCLAERHPCIASELTGYQCSYFTETPNEYNMMSVYWVDPKVRQHFLKTYTQVMDIHREVSRAKTTKEVLDILVKKYLPLVKPLLDEKDKQDQKQKQPQGGSAPSKDKGNKPDPTGGTTNKPNEQPKPEQPGDGSGNGKPIPISMSDLLKGDINADAILGNGVEKSKAAGVLEQLKRHEPRFSEAETAALMRPYITTLATRLRYILQEKASTRFRGLYKQGRLLGKNAYRVLIPNEERIFSQKSTPDSPKHAVYMALDCSGSMDGDRETFAFVGSVILKHVSQLLGFPVKMYSYDGGCRLLHTLDDYRESGGGTSDSEALRMILADSSASDDNLVFLVTDGDTREGDRLSLLNRLKKERNAEVFGIGIGGGISLETVKHNYPHALYVREPKDLPAELINLMRSIIHR
jgi:hypothetical protein